MKKITICIFLMLLPFFSTSAFCENKPQIIDMHMHTSSMKFWGFPKGQPVPRISFPDGFLKEHVSPPTDKAVLDQTLFQMNKHNVVLGFLSGPIEDVTHWVGYAPKRFIPSPMIPMQELNGNYTMPGIGYLKAEHAADESKRWVNLHPSIMGLPQMIRFLNHILTLQWN